MTLSVSPRALYIHIPFCTNKCFYCDFNSVILKGQPVEQYIDALEREIQQTVQQYPPEQIDTVFVGGGTPTVLTPAQMTRFLQIVQHYFPLSPNVEFSMEANPGTVEIDKLITMKQGGVNRISFGVQSFDNHLLEKIGRIHNTDDVYRSIELARQVGFDNLSIDLMFGLPGQTIEQLASSVDKALQLDLKHYSIYGLKVEENTLFHTLYERNELPLPSEEDELMMYVHLIEQLSEAGYEHYEISNFARKGFESKHNCTYWRNESYYGIGAGAHGYANRQRHINIKGVQPYIDATTTKLPILTTHSVTEQEAMEDFMMVGLRMLKGVNNDDFRKQFNGANIEDHFGHEITKLLNLELLQKTLDQQGTYRLTTKGIPLGNEVFGQFLK